MTVKWEDRRGQRPRTLVAPHDSELPPEIPAGEYCIPSLSFSLAELSRLFRFLEDGTYLPATAPSGGSVFHGVEIVWRGGGQTTCAAHDLLGVQRPADMSTVEGRALYADGSSLTFLFRPGRRGRRCTGRIQWSGTGEARERAEAWDTYARELCRGHRGFTTAVADKPWAAALAIAVPTAVVALVVAYVVRAVSMSPDHDSLAWIMLPLPVGAVAGGLWLALSNRLILDGRLVRSRPSPDWPAVGTLASIVGVALSSAIALLAIIVG
ncbi:hypothetical protein [Kribbella sp. DT2]|uniref:hypothetical protein n=1 Tax=Kribbella sp. DT2 TaxID=3393427 RepID=UPI003CF2DDFE